MTTELAQPLPTREGRMEFIVNNAGLLDDRTKKNIYNYVMTEVGAVDETSKKIVVIKNKAGEPEINLTNITNEPAITYIYNIVKNRRHALMQPVKHGETKPALD